MITNTLCSLIGATKYRYLNNTNKLYVRRWRTDAGDCSLIAVFLDRQTYDSAAHCNTGTSPEINPAILLPEDPFRMVKEFHDSDLDDVIFQFTSIFWRDKNSYSSSYHLNIYGVWWRGTGATRMTEIAA